MCEEGPTVLTDEGESTRGSTAEGSSAVCVVGSLCSWCLTASQNLGESCQTLVPSGPQDHHVGLHTYERLTVSPGPEKLKRLPGNDTPYQIFLIT